MSFARDFAPVASSVPIIHSWMHTRALYNGDDLSPSPGPVVYTERMCINDRPGFKILSKTKRSDALAAALHARHVFPSSDVSPSLYKNEVASPCQGSVAMDKAMEVSGGEKK